jgi:DNA-binding NarL/FixJ family response regulator
MKTENCSVLLADDSELDRFLLRRAISSVAPRLKVIGELGDGEEVIAYLSGEGVYRDRAQYPLPDLVVLDSRMPRKGSIEVLEWLRTRDFAQMKVAVLADSSATQLRFRALELGAHFFFSKGLRSDELQEVARSLQAGIERGIGQKVFLRHRRSGCYYQGIYRWSSLRNDAMEFTSFDKAAQYACEYHLTEEVEVFMLYTETGQSFSFPFPDGTKSKDL